MPGAETGVMQGIGGLGQFNTYNIPAAEATTANLYNNPYAGSYQSGATTAGGMGEAAATNAFGAGGGLMSLGQNIANTAFDPQRDLYNRTLQQTTDQSRAGLEARGLDMTPYGAGVEGQTLSNFNIDWQNQQLQREIAGGNAALGLETGGSRLQAGAPGLFMQSAGMPYGAYNTIGGNQMGALNAFGQFGKDASGIPQEQIQDYQNYLGWGTGQQNAGWGQQQDLFTDQLSRDKQAFNQQQATMQGLGKLGGWAFPGGLSSLGMMGMA